MKNATPKTAKKAAGTRKKRQNITLAPEVAAMLSSLAEARYTTMSQLVTDLILEKRDACKSNDCFPLDPNRHSTSQTGQTDRTKTRLTP